MKGTRVSIRPVGFDDLPTLHRFWVEFRGHHT
jgi:hypothetical protein